MDWQDKKNKAVFMVLIHFSHRQSSKQKTNHKNTFLCSQTIEYSVPKPFQNQIWLKGIASGLIVLKQRHRILLIP